MLDVSIIVPTYCEAANLAVLIPRIQAVTRAAGLQAEILIVDDDSPDDTRAVVRRLEGSSQVRLIVRRQERGLSGAVVAGMRQAVGRILVVMDADLSHPPGKIPCLVQAFDDARADFAIGSRYVAGGTTSASWGVYRSLNSRCATLLARPFTSAKDPLAGFFALRKSAFEAARERLDPIGYKIGLELLVKCDCQHVVELPITFHDRLHGASKLSLREQLNYLRHCQRLLIYRHRAELRRAWLALCAASGVALQLLLFGAARAWLPGGLAHATVAAAVAIWICGFGWRAAVPRGKHAQSLPRGLIWCGSCLAGGLLNGVSSVALSSFSTYFAEHPLQSALAGFAVGTAATLILGWRRPAPPPLVPEACGMETAATP
jgi:dolichol-phosphate mannosyltransferase